MYDADAAREAHEEAKRFAKGSGSADEKAESWALAAERFEEGLTLDRYAASQSIACWRRAGNLEKAHECAETALEYFGGDPWVRSNAAWVQFDRIKRIGRNLDEALPAIDRMLALMHGLNDVAVLADSAFFRIRALWPAREAAPTEVVDFLVRHFETLFDGCSSVARDGGDGAKLQLARLMAGELERREQWDDLTAVLDRIVEAFPREARFATLFVRSLMEMGKASLALTVATDALLDVESSELVRLQARAYAEEGRHGEAEQALLAGCYRFRDPWLWRDLAKVRWHLDDIEGSNRALAIALRQVPSLPAGERAEAQAAWHQGRAVGGHRLARPDIAAPEAVAARQALQAAGRALPKALEDVVASLQIDHTEAWAAAEALAEREELAAALAEEYTRERERELEAGLQPAEVRHVDAGKGFGYLTLRGGAEESPEEGGDAKVYFSLQAVPGGGDDLAVGTRVRTLTTPVTNADARRLGAPRRATIVRLDAS